MRRGSTLLLVLVVMFVLAATGLALFGQAESGQRAARRQVLAGRAYYLAESGLHEGMDRLWRGPMPVERTLALAELDPPNRVIVRWVAGKSGALDHVEASATVQDVTVTLRAKVHYEGIAFFMRGRP